MGNTIPEAALPLLRQQILVLRIIVVSLAMGIAVFGAYTIVQNAGKPQVLAGNLELINLLMFGFGLLMLVVGFVLPPIVFRMGTAPHEGLTRMFPAVKDPEVLRVLGIQSRIQTSTIIGCAMHEGAAFANLVAYLFNGELSNLILAAVLLVAVALRFPLPGATEQRIENEVRRQRENELFRNTP